MKRGRGRGCLSDNWSSLCLVQELICGMLGILKVCGVLGILKLGRQAWVIQGDAEQDSRGQEQLTGVPSPPWLLRDQRFEEDSLFRPLPVSWEAYIRVPVGLGRLTAPWCEPWLCRFGLSSQKVLHTQHSTVPKPQGWGGTQVGVSLRSWCRAHLLLGERGGTSVLLQSTKIES